MRPLSPQPRLDYINRRLSALQREDWLMGRLRLMCIACDWLGMHDCGRVDPAKTDSLPTRETVLLSVYLA